MAINFEEISFGIVAMSGEARGLMMEAVQKSKMKLFDEANDLIRQSEDKLIEAEKKHMDAVVEEAQGIKHEFSILFVHAEDQLLTTQTLLLVAREFIELYKRIE
ncbi:hypothetical protein Zmor_012216 [Zophobas morio]|uniref:PTS lactose/cellobiose transporter subunit IIA n=1 Tax=Zophobas morio TaxID=2755281 RepID=A0AA38HGF1_9CUCU|nr:hypothetical protein Zmor_012216 [Zophobas morio]